MKFILFILAGFLLLYFNQPEKQKYFELSDKQEAEGWCLEYVGDDIAKLMHPAYGYLKHVKLTAPEMKLSKTTTQTMQTIDLREADTSLYSGLFIKKDFFPASGGIGYPVQIGDFNHNGLLDYNGALVLDEDSNGLAGNNDPRIVYSDAIIRDELSTSVVALFTGVTKQYLDLNNNGMRDDWASSSSGFLQEPLILEDESGAEYVDWNGNGNKDGGNENTLLKTNKVTFLDVDSSRQYTEKSDLRVVSKDQNFLDLNRNGEWDAGEVKTDQSVEDEPLAVAQSLNFYDENKNGSVDESESIILDMVTYLDSDGNGKASKNPFILDVTKDLSSVSTLFKTLNWKGLKSSASIKESRILISSEGLFYLDITGNGSLDPGEPQGDSVDALKVPQNFVVTQSILQRESDSKRFLDTDSDGKIEVEDVNLDLVLRQVSGKDLSLASVLGLANDQTETELTFIDLDGDGKLSYTDNPNLNLFSVEPLVLVKNGVRFADLNRDKKLNKDLDEDLNSDGVIGVRERNLNLELTSTPNNDFSAIRTPKVGSIPNTSTPVSYLDLDLSGNFTPDADYRLNSISEAFNLPIKAFHDDGSRLTLSEIKNYFQQQQYKSEQDNDDLVSWSLSGSGQLGLQIEVGANDALFKGSLIPSASTTLNANIPIFNYADQKQAGQEPIAFKFKDIKVDLGSFITGVTKDIFEKVEPVIDFLSPVFEVLGKDIKLPSMVGLAEALESDGKPGTSVIELSKFAAIQLEFIAETLAAAGAGQKAKSLAKFVKGFKTVITVVDTIVRIYDVIQATNEFLKAADGETILIPMGEFEVLVNGASSAPEKKASNVDKKDTPTTSDKPQKTGVDALNSTENTGTTDPKKQDAVKKAGGVINTLKNLNGFKFPIATSLESWKNVILGKPADIISYDIPDLEFTFDLIPVVEVALATPLTFSVAGILEGGLKGELTAATDLAVGADTFGLLKTFDEIEKDGFDWADLRYLVDGFYLLDAVDGEDNPLLTIGADFGAYANFNASIAEARAALGLLAELGLDLVDFGEADGTSDGRIRLVSDIIEGVGGTSDSFGDFLISIIQLSGELSYYAELFVKSLGITHVDIDKKGILYQFSFGGGGNGQSGRMTQSYISGGTVFFDTDFDGELDSNEPATITNADGSYNLNVPLAQFDTDQNGQIDVTEGRLVGIGGVDSSGLPFTNPLYGVPSSTMISPVTTLQAVQAKQLADAGADSEAALSQAEATILQALGLPSIDLATFDPILEIEENLNSDGAALYEAHVLIESLLLTGINILENSTTESGPIDDIESLVIEAITEGFVNAGSEVDLTDPVQLKAVVFTPLSTKAKESAGTDLVENFDELIDIATTISAKNNQTIAQIFAETEIEELLEEVADRKYEVQILASETIGNLFADAPILFIEDQLILEDDNFSSAAPVLENLENVTYTATLSDGSPLPDWLTLDPATGIFRGTAENSDLGALDVLLTATGENDVSVTDNLTLIVKNTNDVPVVASEILDQVVIDNEDFTFTIPDYVFADVDPDDPLTYTATLANDDPLPDWLSFDAETLTFSGTPDEAVTEPLNIKVTATDSDGTSVSDTFTFVVGGLVYFDANFNGAFDEGELYAYEQTDGSYEFNAPIDTFDLNDNGTLDLDEGRIVKLGELGETPGITLGSPLYAPPGSEVISPLTTVQTTRSLQLIDDEGMGEVEAIAQSESELEQALGLPDIDFATFDAVAEIDDHQNPVGKQVYQSHLLIESLLLTGISILENATVEPGQISDPTALALEAIAQGLATVDGALDFTDVEQLSETVFAALAETAKTNAGENLVEEFETLLEGAAAIAAKNSQYILQLFADSNMTSILDNVAAKEETIRQQASDILRRLMAGNPTLIIESQSTSEDRFFQSTNPVLANVPDATYTATLSNGSPLPAWMRLDATTGVLSGTPTNSGVGTYSIILKASNEAGDAIDSSFTVTVGNVNDAPTLAQPLADQLASAGDSFSYTLPANAFSDVDRGETLTYTATLTNGQPLPGWLSFDAARLTFAGNLPDGENTTLAIRVTATDQQGVSVSDDFQLNAEFVAPIEANVVDPILDLVLKGSKKNDRLMGGMGHDRINGGKGNDVLLGMDGNDRLIGSQGRDRLKGGEGNDLLKGNKGKDRLIGNAGDDTLIGGKDKDVLKGGSGDDIFVLHKNHGRDVIKDFTDGEDSIKLSGKLSFGQLDITQQGKKTLISFGDNDLAVLKGVQADQLTPKDFV